MTYEVIILGHLHMPLYFIGTFTEYSKIAHGGRGVGLSPVSCVTLDCYRLGSPDRIGCHCYYFSSS